MTQIKNLGMEEEILKDHGLVIDRTNSTSSPILIHSLRNSKYLRKQSRNSEIESSKTDFHFFMIHELFARFIFLEESKKKNQRVSTFTYVADFRGLSCSQAKKMVRRVLFSIETPKVSEFHFWLEFDL